MIQTLSRIDIESWLAGRRGPTKGDREEPDSFKGAISSFTAASGYSSHGDSQVAAPGAASSHLRSPPGPHVPP